MPAATSMAASSLAISAMALSEAEKAKCVAVLGAYKSDTATTAQMQEYASCVKRIHSDPMDPSTIIALKIAIVITLMAMMIGGVLGWRDDGPVGFAMFGLVGATIALCVMFVLVLIAAGVMFLFS